jgi:hypothetical protein
LYQKNLLIKSEIRLDQNKNNEEKDKTKTQEQKQQLILKK